jgi:uncharacterized protein YcbX
MSTLGTVAALYRYPVKSMIGEELETAQIGAGGVAGDRAYALIDPTTPRIGTAKIPRKWAQLRQCTPRFVSEPVHGDGLPPVRITLPDGAVVVSDQPDIDSILSRLFGFEVTLTSEKPAGLKLEHAAPGGDQIDFESTVDYPVINGFFDLGFLHLNTTATYDSLRSLYPAGRFEARRFRPNIVIQTPNGETGFAEQTWVGKTIAIGDEVRLRILMPTTRCVVTTLPQDDLPNDPGILRTAAQHSSANVGVYAVVEREGSVRQGDEVSAAL